MSKERLKFIDEIDDVATNVFDETEGVEGAFVSRHESAEGRRCHEAWMGDELSLHVHLRVRVRIGESEPDDLCLTFLREHVVRDSLLQENGIGVPPYQLLDSSLVGQEHLDHKGTVLIDVRQIGKPGEFVSGGVFSEIPAMVRLRPLDECPGMPLNIDPVQGTGTPLRVPRIPDVPIKICPLGIDGKGVVLTRLVAVDEDKLGDEVIQRRSEVLDGISAKDTQTRRRNLAQKWVHTYNVPETVKGVIEADSLGVRFQECEDLAFERVKVFVSPLELESRFLK